MRYMLGLAGIMGTRSIYEGNFELFSVTASVEEYPSRVYNHHEIDVQNCQVIQDNLDFNLTD